MINKLTEQFDINTQKANEKCNGRIVLKGGNSRYLMSNCKCWQESGNIGSVECLKTEFKDIERDSYAKDKGGKEGAKVAGTKRTLDEI